MSWAPVPNKPTVSVDVKQHFNHKVLFSRTGAALQAPFSGTVPFMRKAVESRCLDWSLPSGVIPGREFQSVATVAVEVLLYVHRNRRFIMDGCPGRPPRLSHSS